MDDPNIELLTCVAEALGICASDSSSSAVAPPPCCSRIRLRRGRGDYLESHDLEDVLSVVDGRPEIVPEMAASEPELRQYVASVFARLIADEGFVNALPGLIIEGSPATRVPIVLDRLRKIAAMAAES